MKIAVLPGDGIGPEIIRQALKVLQAMRSAGLKVEFEEAPIGGAGFDACKDPLRERPAPSRDCCASARNWGCSQICAPPFSTKSWRRRRR
jgi:isocitrate/isopropylmalate dehydrogenase